MLPPADGDSKWDLVIDTTAASGIRDGISLAGGEQYAVKARSVTMFVRRSADIVEDPAGSV